VFTRRGQRRISSNTDVTVKEDIDAGTTVGRGNARPVASCVRHNVVDVAPLWIQLYRSAIANVQVDGGARYTAPPLRPSRHIDAIFELVPDQIGDNVVPRFSAARAAQLPDIDWPPALWD
jgi:hypothetical protein